MTPLRTRATDKMIRFATASHGNNKMFTAYAAYIVVLQIPITDKRSQICRRRRCILASGLVALC